MFFWGNGSCHKVLTFSICLFLSLFHTQTNTHTVTYTVMKIRKGTMQTNKHTNTLNTDSHKRHYVIFRPPRESLMAVLGLPLDALP